MTNCCAGCAEPGKYSHTTDCLFEHCLSFLNLTGCTPEEKRLMRIAYGYGKEEGERPRSTIYSHRSYGMCGACQMVHVEGPCR